MMPISCSLTTYAEGRKPWSVLVWRLRLETSRAVASGLGDEDDPEVTGAADGDVGVDDEGGLTGRSAVDGEGGGEDEGNGGVEEIGEATGEFMGMQEGRLGNSDCGSQKPTGYCSIGVGKQTAGAGVEGGGGLTRVYRREERVRTQSLDGFWLCPAAS